MQVFDEIKGRGVEDVLFISMDGVSGLEEGARSIFKDVVVQSCIVHLIRNSVKYIPSKDHPSGNPTPSAEDFDFTNRIREAGDLLNVHLDDSLIISNDGTYYSFMQEGRLS